MEEKQARPGRSRTAEQVHGAVLACIDGDWYRHRYPDVAAHGDDPPDHYLRHGWREGRQPNAAFDPAWYARQAGPTLPATLEPLTHYCAVGEAQGRRPAPWFDPAWYRAARKVAPDTLALLHYLRHRLEPGVHPSPAFNLPLRRLRTLCDGAWYLRRYPDVAAHGMDPLLHYRTSGWREGRWPNPAFDPAWYRTEAGLPPGADGDPLSHYGQTGEAAGLRPVPWFDPAWYRATCRVPAATLALAHYLRARDDGLVSPNPVFDPAYYRRLSRHRDGDPYQHYLHHGQPAGLLPRAEDELLAASGLLDPDFYRFDSPDAGPDMIDVARHYLGIGEMAGRRPNPYFDPSVYAACSGTALPGVPADISRLTHYLLAGEAQDLCPSLCFDPGWYRRANGIPAFASPLAHYLAHRRSWTVSPLPLFDAVFYTARYGDTIRPGRDPFLHYLAVGARRGFQPAPWFDADAYRAAHMTVGDHDVSPDVQTNPLLHLLTVSLRRR